MSRKKKLTAASALAAAACEAMICLCMMFSGCLHPTPSPVPALAAAACEAMICLCMMFSGCLHPTPSPVPGPAPASPDAASPDVVPADVSPFDPFKNQDFDCHLPIVDTQYTVASQSVSRCLSSPPLACLAGLIPVYDINTVACVARDLGFEANNRALAGTDAGDSSTVAENVRAFINTEHLGFK